LFDVIVVML